ncbi:hypothetical protein E2562_033006 [Oryza meyeriana var. granulata]|uniref:Dirigent protein n=1 Tax=Oryza meyeriana var. granulata TaxID=110450 RepID=A0A6G1CWE6_9ORYZ|nr:hypothetical protein E2562_033006 [Oryza meyeriana var. granulata]
MAGSSASVPAIKAAVWLVVIALAGANGAFTGRVLEEQPAAAPAEAPLPADPLPAPTDPPADPVVAPAAVPAGGAAATGNAGAAGVGAGGGAAGAAGAGDHPLTFFMHDILGGSRPSARIVTGVVASAAANGQLPFARPNENIFPIQGAVPLPQGASNLINGNNVPYVAGLGGTAAAIVQSNGNSGNKNIPFVNAGDLPSGVTLQNLLFGTTTVIDDGLTEGHELGAAVIGRAQGFYVASSQDGTSKTLLLTAMFEGGVEHGDTLSFFGVHRMAAPESHVTIIGGTGKYENAKGFAAIQTLHPGDEHTTDGVETLLQFSIHLI